MIEVTEQSAIQNPAYRPLFFSFNSALQKKAEGRTKNAAFAIFVNDIAFEMSDNSLKQKTRGRCMTMLNERIDELVHQMAELVESAAGDSKSTAGDKHETGRAMMHMEQEQLGRQLHELQTQRSLLSGIPADTGNNIVTEGSLVITSGSPVYIAVALGKIQIDGLEIFTVSAKSPIAAKLMGRKEQDTIELNGQTIKIIQIR